MNPHHHDHHAQKSSLTFDERMIKLLDHWIKHNSDHAETYREWAKRAAEKNLSETGAILNEVAEMSAAINTKLMTAAEKVKKGV